METSVKNKWQIRLAVLLIFVIGFVAGALTMNVYRARHQASAPDERRGRFERVMEQLNLSAEQREQVRAIFNDARAQLNEVRNESRPRYRALREQTQERLRSVLTPEQWAKFQEVTADFKERRSRRANRNDD